MNSLTYSITEDMNDEAGVQESSPYTTAYIKQYGVVVLEA